MNIIKKHHPRAWSHVNGAIERLYRTTWGISYTTHWSTVLTMVSISWRDENTNRNGIVAFGMMEAENTPPMRIALKVYQQLTKRGFADRIRQKKSTDCSTVAEEAELDEEV